MSSRTLLIAVCAALAAPLLAIAAQPARILIVTGQSDYPYHDWRSTTPFLEQVLERTGRFDVRVTEEPKGLTREALAGFDAVLLNYNGPRWGTEAETALEDFVRRNLFSRRHVVKVNCKLLFSRVKNRRGGPRI